MSNSTREHSPRGRAADESSLRATFIAGPLAALGFWTGIALPFLYVPLLLVGPQGRPEHTIAFALVALHAFALLVGHSHRQDAGSGT